MGQIFRIVRDTGLGLAALGRTVLGSVRDNSGLAVVSVVLAFGLWILVTDAENPTQTQLLPENLTVEAVNVPSNVVIHNDLVSVQVVVSVESKAFDSLTPADFKATVNVEGLGVGSYDLPVEVSTLTSRGGLKVEEVRPARVRVDLSPLVAKDVPVVLDVKGTPPEGYTVGTPKTKDAAVRVSGAQDLVDRVTRAFAAVDVTARTSSFEESLRLEPQNENGDPIEGVKLEPGVTTATVNITQVIYSKVLVVDPVIEGVPAEGFEVVSVSAQPATVVVSGDATFIAQVQTIRTEGVKIGGENSEVVRSVSLDLSALPDGAKVLGSGNVTVTVGITKRPEPSTWVPAALLAEV